MSAKNVKVYSIRRKYFWCPKKFEIFFGVLSKCKNIQYCDRNIELFSIAPHKVIALIVVALSNGKLFYVASYIETER